MSALKKNAAKQAEAFEGKTAQSEKIKKVRAPADGLLWRFSFRFFREIEFFGLKGGKIDNTWLLSVMERLGELGGKKIDELERDSAEAGRWRYHPINWSATKIPVKKSELHWIEPDYRDNAEEFPLMQFQVSKGKGRIIGFFDEENVFQVVLLDPLHNMQPSKDYGYAVDPCSALGCELTQLRDGISEVLAPKGITCECGVAGKVRAVLDETGYERYPVLVLRVPDQGDLDDAEKLIGENKAANYWDIFQHGLVALAG